MKNWGASLVWSVCLCWASKVNWILENSQRSQDKLEIALMNSALGGTLTTYLCHSTMRFAISSWETAQQLNKKRQKTSFIPFSFLPFRLWLSWGWPTGYQSFHVSTEPISQQSNSIKHLYQKSSFPIHSQSVILFYLAFFFLSAKLKESQKPFSLDMYGPLQVHCLQANTTIKIKINQCVTLCFRLHACKHVHLERCEFPKSHM